MIFYATKKTIECYKITLPDDIKDPSLQAAAQAVLVSEAGNPMLEWGMKIFYFDRRKCLQVVHFASRMAFFLVDIKQSELNQIAPLVTRYLYDLFADDPEILKLTNRLISDHPSIVVDQLKNRSIISQLNFTQRNYLDDGYRLYDYMDNGILRTLDLSHEYNRNYISGGKTPDGKRDYRYGAERFKEAIMAYYAEKN